jgi:hypothetical protein
VELGPLLVVLRFAVTTLVNVEVGVLMLAGRLLVVKITEVALWKRAVVEVRVRVEVVVDELSEEVKVWLVMAVLLARLEMELEVAMGLTSVRAVVWRAVIPVLAWSVTLTKVIVVVERMSVWELE